MKTLKIILALFVIATLAPENVSAKHWLFKSVKELRQDYKEKKSKQKSDSKADYSVDDDDSEKSSAASFSGKKKKKGGKGKSFADMPDLEEMIEDEENQIKKEYPDFQFYSFEENELEWSEFKEKKASALVTANGLVLKNDGSSDNIMTYTDLPINTDRDFIITASIFASKFEKTMPVDIIINMEDQFNYGLITIEPETVKYTQYKGNQIAAQQSTLINGKKGKKTTLSVSIQKKGGKIICTVNNDPCLNIRKIDYTNTGFGFKAAPGQTITISTIGCGNADNENEK